MAETVRTVSLNVLAKLEQFEAEIKQKLPNITEKAATAAALRMQSTYLAAEKKRIKAFEDAAKKQARLYKETMGAAFQAAAAYFSLSFAKQTFQFLRGLAQNLADTRNALGDMSAAVGQSVESLQVLGFAAKTSGGDFSELEESLKGVPKRLLDFARGAGEAAPALRALGFSQAEVTQSLRDGVDLLPVVLDRLQGVQSAQMKAALATSIFAEKGTRLLQVLGDKSYAQWLELTRRYSVDVGPAAIEASQRWEAAMAMVNGKWQQFAETLIESFGGINAAIESAAGLAATLDFLGTTINTGTRIWTLWVQAVGGAAAATRAFAEGDLSGAATVASRALKRWAKDAEEIGGQVVGSFEKASQVYRDFVKDVSAFTRANERAGTSIGDLGGKAEDLESVYQNAVKALVTATEDIEGLPLFKGKLWQQARKDAMSFTGPLHKALDEAKEKGIITFEAWEEASRTVADRTARELKRAYAEAVKDIVANALSGFDQIAGAAFQLSDTLYQNKIDSLQREGEVEQEAYEEARDKRKERLAAAEALEAKWEGVRDTSEMSYDEKRRMRTDKANAYQLRLLAETAKQEEKAAKKAARAKRQELRKVAKAEKRMAIFGIIVNGVLAIAKGFAQMGPIGGAIAAVAMGITTAAQVAAVSARPLPSFFRGGVRTTSMGEGQATVHRGEAVLTRSGVDRVGGAGVVDAINAGFRGASVSPTVVLDSEVISDHVAARMRRSGALRHAAREANNTGRDRIYG